MICDVCWVMFIVFTVSIVFYGPDKDKNKGKDKCPDLVGPCLKFVLFPFNIEITAAAFMSFSWHIFININVFSPFSGQYCHFFFLLLDRDHWWYFDQSQIKSDLTVSSCMLPKLWIYHFLKALLHTFGCSSCLPALKIWELPKQSVIWRGRMHVTHVFMTLRR